MGAEAIENENMKLQHWCGLQAINARKSAPVLEFSLILLWRARLSRAQSRNGCRTTTVSSRSGPVETMAIDAPTSCSMRFR